MDDLDETPKEESAKVKGKKEKFTLPPAPPTPRKIIGDFVAQHQAGQRVFERVTELDGKLETPVYVGTMNGDEHDDFDIAYGKIKEENGDESIRGIRGLIAAATICDEHGTMLFGVDRAKDFARCPAWFLNPVLKRSKRLNLLTQEDIEAAKGN